VVTEALPQELDADLVVLRRQQPSDARELAAAIALSLADLAPWLPWATPAAASPLFQRHRLADAVANWGHAGYPAGYVMIDKRDSSLVGACEIHRRHSEAPRLGYWIRSDRTGRGFATVAVGALVEVALRLPEANYVEIRCDQANVRSVAVAQRLGFTLAEVVDHSIDAPGQTGKTIVWRTAQRVRAGSAAPPVNTEQ
jgi:RimJ/RimL family protein N-acetyltransferase